MTRKEELKAWQAIALDRYADEDDPKETMKHDMEACATPTSLALGYYWAAKELVQNGAFACYYSQAEATLKDIYGESYDATRYYNKDGSLKYKNGQAYLWTIYVHKMAQAISKLYE